MLVFAAMALCDNMPASAGDGYEVRDHDALKINDPLTDSTGADRLAPLLDAPPATFAKLLVTTILLSMATMGLFPLAGKVKELFNNENRRRLYEYVAANPGCTIASLSEGLHMNIGTVDYHLFQLKCRFKVKVVREGKYCRIYDNTKKFSGEEQTVCSHIRGHVSQVLLMAILSNPGITQKQLSEIAMLDASTMSYYSNKFRSDGLIVVEKDGRFKRYFIDEDAKLLLEKHMQPIC